MSVVSVSPETIWNTLQLPRVAGNVRRMYHVGTQLEQESGFAIYQNQRGMQISRLVVPPVDTSGISLELERERATTFNVLPLVRKRIKTLHDLTIDEQLDPNKKTRYNRLLNEAATRKATHQISPKAQRRIDAVQNTSSLDSKTQDYLIDDIKENDMALDVFASKNIRSDVSLLFHNHPLIRFTNDAAVDVTPSPADIRLYESLRPFSPNFIKGIVGSNGRSHQALLFAAITGKTTNLAKYEHSIDELVPTRRALGLLATAGYGSVLLPLQDDGRPEPQSRELVDTFAATING